MKKQIHTGLKVLLTAFVFAGLFVQTASANCNIPTDPVGIHPTFEPGNPSLCEGGYRINDPNSGTYNLPNGDGTITITVTNTSCGQVFSWSISGYARVDYIIAKGGPNANKYDYSGTSPRPGSDGKLHAPINSSNGNYYGLSHIDICYSPCEPCVLSCPLPATVECPNSTHPNATGYATGSGECGQITWSDNFAPACGNTGTITRTFSAPNYCINGTSTCQQIITVTDNTPPTISCPANETIHCPATPVFGTPTAIDACGTATVSIISTTTTQGDCPQEYSTTRTWKATDACGNSSATCSQTITVVDNTPPTISCPANDIIHCPATPVFGTPTAFDVCGTATISQVGMDVETPGDCPQEYSKTRTWKATDACGNTSATCSQIITVVDNDPPTISCPTNETIHCPATPVFGTPTAFDVCGTATISQVGSDVTTPGDCPQEYSKTRTWKATDACGNTSATCSQTITVVDNDPPTISCPANDIIHCPATPVFGMPTAFDACGTATISQVGSDVTTPGDCPQEYSKTRTWKATDACGNTSVTCSQTIMVVDNVAPTISCPNINVQCFASVPLASNTDGISTYDACGNVTVTYVENSETTTYNGCANRATITRIYRASDGCNSATCERTINVNDNTPPAISCTPTYTAECGENPPSPPPATATDNCGGNVTITYDDAGGFCGYNGGSFTRTWTATDDCGNSSTCQTTVTCQACGCTYTQGYWKTHSSYGPAPYDDGWLAIGPLGADETFFLSGQSWYEVFWTSPNNPPSAKAYYQLAHQYMAAKLNILNGAGSTTEVNAAITWAESFFTSYTPANVPNNLRSQANSYATLLDNYNNGLIGPGHCSNEQNNYSAGQAPTILEEAQFIQLTSIPNPFVGTVQFTLNVPYDSPVTLDVFNASGQKVGTVFSAYLEAGQERTVTFDGSKLAEGLYIYRLTTDREVKTGQLVSLK